MHHTHETTETLDRRSAGADSTVDSSVDHYLAVFQRRLTLLLAGRAPAHVIDDVVQSEVLHLFERRHLIMANYSDPMAYASTRGSGGRALIDHVRRDNVQRGRGAKGTRSVVDGDAAHVVLGASGFHKPGSGTNYEYAADARSLESHDCLERNASHDLLHAALLQLPADQRTLLLLVDAYGYTVTQAAAMLGVRRETAARKHSAALRAVREIGADLPTY